MIATLRQLAARLGQADATVDGLVRDLGGRGVDLGGNVLVDEPTVEGIDRASVVRDVDGEAPAHVALDLDDSPSLGDLAAAFGTPTPVPPEYEGGPDRLLYGLETVAVIASLEEGRSRRIILRRDRRPTGDAR